MLGVKPLFVLEESNPKRSFSFAITLVLLATSPLCWMGCNTLPQSFASPAQTSAQSAQNISIETTLPNGFMGSSYREVLSVRGGIAPYRFAVSQGQLPPGLLLDPETGSISGSPTRAGDFAFTIAVTGEPMGSSGTRAYTVAIDGCVKCVTVQISPANPLVAAGGNMQFSAVVRNTSNTAVLWSASAGSISADGLFKAPANASAKSISVTASSVAENTAQASAEVTLTSDQFAITTSSVPAAEESTPYSASLTAHGGQPPYEWGIISGSLPKGLKLSAESGVLSGSATQAGTFTFKVQGTDAASHTSQQTYTLLVSASGQTCGPPAYNCSRTDLNIVQVQPEPPNVGNLLGANTVVTDPDFGNRIVRITDSKTNPEATFENRTYVTTSSGSADDNLWNTDSTLFIVQDSGAGSYPFSFNPSTMQAARMYVASFPTTNGLKLWDDGTWSRVSPNVLYTYNGTAISKYDFTDRTNPPSPEPVYDFTSSRNCLPAGFAETWKARGGVSGDDTVFGMAYSNRGGQGTGVFVAVYKVGSGCSVLNTQTGQVGGDWGANGTINVTDRWTIHNVKLSKDGNWMVIVSTLCTSNSCSTSPYFWQIGTTNVISCGDGGSCSGHWTEGYRHWENNDNSPMSNQVIRSLGQATSVSNLTHTFPPGITVPFDQHQSWNNVDPADSLPFFSTTCSSTTPFPAPWYNEIIAVSVDGSGKTWRFAHSFITARSQTFSTKNGIGTVSQDGKFFVFSSDWMGKLGSVKGATTCTTGSDCRGDVFVVELR